MKQKYLKTLALGLLMVAGINSALAESYDGTSAVYSPTTKANYATLADAVNAFSSSSNTEFEIDLYKDVTVDSRITCSVKKSLSIIPKADIAITKNMSRGNIWFLNNGSGVLTIGNSEHKITIKGDGQAKGKEVLNNILRIESSGDIVVNNVTFSDIKFDTDKKTTGYLYANKAANNLGTVTFENVTVENCTTTQDAFIKSIATKNDCVNLVGFLNFNNCTGVDISIAARMHLGAKGGTATVSNFTASTPISVTWNGTTTIGTPVIVKAKLNLQKYFTLSNNDFGLFGNNTDLKLTQAYTLNVSNAGATTLVLPFESTIPTGAKCYTLAYTSGSTVNATEIIEKLSANTPVLVNAEEGTYKFVSTATSGDAATGTGTTTFGALTGVYSTTTVPNNSYILYNGDDGIGFYKVDGTTNTVNANRAYLTANVTSGAKSLSIVYDDNTTGISSITNEENVQSSNNNTQIIYNLAGQRVGKDYKGVVIKNGRKFLQK